MRKLIVNADDFGFNLEVTDGILECHKNGCVSSTTLMTHMPAAEYAVERSKEFPELSVGIHLAINTGRPLSNPETIPSLVDSKGNFKNSTEIVRLAKHCKLPVDEVEHEFTVQMERFLSFGITPSHCDGHQNITVNPQPFIAMMRIVNKYNINKMRTYRGWYRRDKSGRWRFNNFIKTFATNACRAPKTFYYALMHYYLKSKGYRLPDEKCGFYKVISTPPLKPNFDGWKSLLSSLPEGVCELVTHPGLPSNDPWDKNYSRDVRVREYELFSNPKTKELCKEFDVEIINYKAI